MAERASAVSLAGGVPIYDGAGHSAVRVCGDRMAARRAAARRRVPGRAHHQRRGHRDPRRGPARGGRPSWRAALLAVWAWRWLLGTPIFAVLAGTGLVLFLTAGGPLAAVPTEIFDIVSSPLLPTIPLFTLAGALLARGSTPERLVRGVPGGGTGGFPAARPWRRCWCVRSSRRSRAPRP